MGDKEIRFGPASATLHMEIPPSEGVGEKPKSNRRLKWLLILSGLIALILSLFAL